MNGASSFAALAVLVLGCGGSADSSTTLPAAPVSTLGPGGSFTRPPPPPSPYEACSVTSTGPCAVLDLVENKTAFGIDAMRSRVAIDEASFYWASADTLWRVPKSGGTLTVVYSNGYNFFGNIAVDANAVYWTGNSPAGGFEGLLRIAKTGGPATRLLSAFAGRVALDTTDAYVSELDGPNPRLFRVPLSGAPPIQLATDLRCEVLATDDTSVYCGTDGSVFRFSKNGGEKESVIHEAVGGNRMLLFEGNVYVPGYGTALFQRFPVDGGTPQVIDLGTKWHRGLTGWAGALYLIADESSDGARQGQSTIRRLPLDGGIAQELEVPDFTVAAGPLVDSTGVYWLDWRFTCLRGVASPSMGKYDPGVQRCDEGRAETRVIRAPLGLR